MRDPPGQDQLKSDLEPPDRGQPARAGIEIPFPQRTLHVPPAEIDALVARLRGEAPAPQPASSAEPAAASGIAFPAAPVAGARPRRRWSARMRGAGRPGDRGPPPPAQHLSPCFVGAEAVEWLDARPGPVAHEAIQLGQRLVERGVIHHVLDEHPFRDGNFFYRFYADEDGHAPRRV